MIQNGKRATLTVLDIEAEGGYLDGGHLGEVFIAKKELNDKDTQGSKLDVFVYLDSDGLPIATKKTPLAELGDFALLRVTQVNKVGAFLDWGLDKDLLVPFAQQKPKMAVGSSYLVHIYQDSASKRLCASSNLNRFIDKTPPNYKPKQEVDLIVAAKTELGYKMVVNHAHFGVVYHDSVFKPLFVGQKLKGYIKKVREDGKIDLSLEAIGMAKIDSLSETILAKLHAQGGRLPIGDKSTPEQIKKILGTSKANFKKAIGKLYKEERIELDATSISLK